MVLLDSYAIAYFNIHVSAKPSAHTVYKLNPRELSDSVVECLTRDRGAAGSSLTSVVVLEQDTFILS